MKDFIKQIINKIRAYLTGTKTSDSQNTQPPQNAPEVKKPFVDPKILKLKDNYIFEMEAGKWTHPDATIFDKEKVLDFLAQMATDARIKLRQETGMKADGLVMTGVFFCRRTCKHRADKICVRGNRREQVFLRSNEGRA